MQNLDIAQSSFFSFSPRIQSNETQLIVKDNLLRQICRLFFCGKTTIVDNQSQMVTVKSRFLWFITTKKEVEFKHIHYIDYTFHESVLVEFARMINSDINAMEHYKIHLVTHDKRKLLISTVSGAGAYEDNGILELRTKNSYDPSGLSFGSRSDGIDLVGTQQEDSRELAVILSERIGVPLGEHNDFGFQMATCKSCGQQVSQNVYKCQYCGGAVH